MSSDSAPFGFPKRPGSPVRPHGLEEAVRAGRRRLRRSALWSAGAVLSVVGVVAGATLVDGTGNDALVVVPASPAPDAVPSGTPSPAGSLAPSAGASPVPRPGAVTAASPVPGGAGGEPAQVEGGGDPGAAPGTADRRTPYREEPSTITTYGSCLDNGVADGSSTSELCVQDYARSETVRSGEEVVLQVDVCTSLRRSDSATLEFATGREHDVTVLSGGAQVWNWSRTHTFPEGEHTRRLPPGNCLAWVTTWHTRDDAGRLVPPGTYTVVSSVDVNGRTRSVEMEIEVTG